MERLVDATSLKDRASEYTLNEDEYKRFCAIIDAEPTAHDVDAVVKQLKKIEEHCLDMHDWQGQSAIEHAIEIVKGGGVDA